MKTLILLAFLLAACSSYSETDKLHDSIDSLLLSIDKYKREQEETINLLKQNNALLKKQVRVIHGIGYNQGYIRGAEMMEDKYVYHKFLSMEKFRQIYSIDSLNTFKD